MFYRPLSVTSDTERGTDIFVRKTMAYPWFTIVGRGFAGAADILKGALRDRRRQPVTGSIKTFQSAPRGDLLHGPV